MEKDYGDIIETWSNKKRDFFEEHKSISVWVPSHVKDDYAALQQESGRTFSQTLVEIVSLAIKNAKTKLRK